MSDAASLHCPDCGAPADPGDRRCRYCKARLATVSCPSCFALMFEGAAFCAHCGARRERAEGGDEDARCAGCKSPLRQLEVGSTRLLECPSCDGIWVDAAVFERLCADKEAQAAVLHKFGGRDAAPAERVRYRPCVRCGKMMNRINFGRISGTIVDVCKGHGTHLDPGELHRIVQFIQGGGLERARMRQLEEIKERERELRDLEAKQARDRGRSEIATGRSGFASWSFLVGDD